MPAPSGSSPFAGTAQYYDRFRAPYPSAAIDFIVESFGLDGEVRALDLGSGPGTLAIPLARAAAEVVAVDPDAQMLAEGRRLAAAAGRGNIRWVQAKAEDISETAGSFRVATIGQAFHWMDRDAVLRKLAVLLADGGGLALVNPGRRRPQESWEPVAAEVIARFLGPPKRHPQANPDEPRHEPALRRSGYFARFSAFEFPGSVRRDIASITGCIYSTSSSARPLFGDDAAAFEAQLAQALLEINPAGVFSEHVETEVMIAPKAVR